MKRLLILIMVLLAINMTYAVTMAQDQPPASAPESRQGGTVGPAGSPPEKASSPEMKPDDGKRVEGRPEMEGRREDPRTEEREGMMENPKFQAEMKRHGDAMKGFFIQIKALRDKIRKEMQAKFAESQGAKVEPSRPGGTIPAGQGVPPGGNTQGNDTSPKLPAGPDNSEGIKPPAGQTPAEGQEPEAKLKADLMKLLAPYHGEARQIADKISSELVTHHQNMLKIVTDDKDTIADKITEKIMMPPKRHSGPGGQGMDQKKEALGTPDSSEHPNKDGKSESSDKDAKPEQNEKSGGE